MHKYIKGHSLFLGRNSRGHSCIQLIHSVILLLYSLVSCKSSTPHYYSHCRTRRSSTSNQVIKAFQTETSGRLKLLTFLTRQINGGYYSHLPGLGPRNEPPLPWPRAYCSSAVINSLPALPSFCICSLNGSMQSADCSF